MSYKKIVLHPLDDQGQPNTGINLFPDTLSSSLLKSDGETPFVPAEKDEVEEALHNKLNKIEGNALVYATSENGVDTSLKWSQDAEANTIGRRTSSGTMKVANPTEIDDAATKDYVDDEISELSGTKQDELISGENIKTINGESLLGSGDIDVQGNDIRDIDLTYSSDTLTATLINRNGELVSHDTATIPLSTKVDKIAGKGLSTNDFTNEDKAKLDSDYSKDEIDGLINNIEKLIPAQASEENQLADKDFVNSSITTNTAFFLGTYNIVTDLGLTTSATHAQVEAKLDDLDLQPTNNDYVFVSYPDSTDPNQYTKFERYKYNSESEAWGFEYELNNSSFTAEQWAAINSGITSDKVSAYDAHLVNTNNPHSVTKSQVGLGNVDNTSDINKPVSTAQAEALGLKVNKSVIANEYDSASTYALGAKVMHDGRLYKCTTAISTAEEWTAAHWSEIRIDNGYVDLDSNQIITGQKTFNSGIKLSNIISIGSHTNNANFDILAHGSEIFTFSFDSFKPRYSNQTDLGASGRGWKDLYLAGSLIGSNTLKLSDIPNKNTIAPDYDTSATYKVGDKVYYNNKLYTCTTAISSAEAWNSSHWTETKVSSGFVDRDSQQYISGAKTFAHRIYSNGGVGNLYTYFDFAPNAVLLNGNGVKDIGASTLRIRDFYIAGSLKDGTNSISVADIAGSTFNVINASDITNNTLTDAQYTLITNGKPTLLNGTFNSYTNLLLSGVSESENYFYGTFIAGYKYGAYRIVKSSKIVQILNRTDGYLELRSIGIINGKSIPVYPSTTGSFDISSVSGTLTWVAKGEYDSPTVSSNTAELSYVKINNLSLASDTTLTLATPAANSYPEYQAFITNTSGSAITITFPSGTKIKTNDEDNVVISSNTISLAAGVTIECSLENNCLIAINFNAQ